MPRACSNILTGVSTDDAESSGGQLWQGTSELAGLRASHVRLGVVQLPRQACAVQARSRKVEAQSKLEQLQRDIAELSSLSPETVAAEEEVTHKLQQVPTLCPAELSNRHMHLSRRLHMFVMCPCIVGRQAAFRVQRTCP